MPVCACDIPQRAWIIGSRDPRGCLLVATSNVFAFVTVVSALQYGFLAKHLGDPVTFLPVYRPALSPQQKMQAPIPNRRRSDDRSFKRARR